MFSNLWTEITLLRTNYPILSPAILVFVGLQIYYRIVVVKPVELHCKKDSLYHKFLKKNLPILSENYLPTFWCFEARMQTVLASFLRRTLPNINYRREILKLSDGGEVCLDWLDCEKGKESSHPTVLFMPGLTGNSQSEYIKSFINVARYQKLGARCVVFSYRGLGGVPIKTPRTYCASNTDDVSEVIDHIKKLHPESPLMALGVSLGGIILGNYLVAKGEQARTKLVAAMLVSVAWDCFKGTESLEKWGLNLMLNRHLANCLVDSVRNAKHHFDKGKYAFDSVFSSRTVKQFDQSFTAPQFGYKDVDEYYKDACLVGNVKHIKVPVLAINAHDDPFQPGEALPTDETSSNDYVAIMKTQYGGHIGFMEGWAPTRYHFSDRVFSQFANGVFSNLDTLNSF